MFAVFLILIYTASAATIYGNIYDLSLDRVEGAVVEINTNPMQRFVAVNGTYSIEVPPGKYTILAYYRNGQPMAVAENITIVQNGDYVLDLFLYPDIDDELFDDLNLDIENPYPDRKFSWLIGAALLLILAAAFFFFRARKNKGESKTESSKEKIQKAKPDLSRIISLLEKNDGRMTQRELRKELPLSEAKISLMVAELESLGKVKKIKKGRGNIIILEK